MYNWYKAEGISINEWPDGTMKEVMAGEKRVGLLKKEGKVYAFAATCPHAGVPLCDGWLDAQGRIVCPLHKYRFDPANGRNTSGEGYKLRTYAVELRDDDIYIGYI